MTPQTSRVGDSSAWTMANWSSASFLASVLTMRRWRGGFTECSCSGARSVRLQREREDPLHRVEHSGVGLGVVWVEPVARLRAEAAGAHQISELTARLRAAAQCREESAAHLLPDVEAAQ